MPTPPPRVLVETKVVKQEFPDAFLVEPKEPLRNATTWGGVLGQLDAYKGAYGQCVAQLAAGRAWKAANATDDASPSPVARPDPGR